LASDWAEERGRGEMEMELEVELETQVGASCDTLGWHGLGIAEKTKESAKTAMQESSSSPTLQTGEKDSISEEVSGHTYFCLVIE
jgi:hypothetical protein